MIRAVFDTNVIVSSLFNPTGVPGRLLRGWRAGEFKLCLSEPLLDEMKNVLDRPAIREQLPVTLPQIQELIRLLTNNANYPEGLLEIEPVVMEDPADDVVVATAVATRADCIVSGDRHLLALESHQGIPIVAPRRFVELLREAPPD